MYLACIFCNDAYSGMIVCTYASSFCIVKPAYVSSFDCIFELSLTNVTATDRILMCFLTLECLRLTKDQKKPGL